MNVKSFILGIKDNVQIQNKLRKLKLQDPKFKIMNNEFVWDTEMLKKWAIYYTQQIEYSPKMPIEEMIKYFTRMADVCRKQPRRTMQTLSSIEIQNIIKDTWYNARLTHPLAGMKYETVEDYLKTIKQ